MEFTAALTLLINGFYLTRKSWKGTCSIALREPVQGEEITTEVFTAESGNYVTPWLPSTTDLLAKDWQIVEE